jgi:hypothetical protein
MKFFKKILEFFSPKKVELPEFTEEIIQIEEPPTIEEVLVEEKTAKKKRNTRSKPKSEE